MNQPTTHIKTADLLIRNAMIFDGSGAASKIQDIAIIGDKISAVGDLAHLSAAMTIDAQGLALAPGFIDVHTHDDLEVIRNPSMLAKISQGVTTVIVGNCGISASPFKTIDSSSALADPINLLGAPQEFRYGHFADYVKAITQAQPATNVLALVGHTALRAQVMDDLHQPANQGQITAMQQLLHSAMQQGAKGLSTGLAYHNANASSLDEITQLASVLTKYQGKYTTHLRSEFDDILAALDEAFAVGREAQVDVVISHLKCAGKANWGRSQQVLQHIQHAQQHQHIGCDCYPYNASSSTLDLKQVTDDFEIFITWSTSHPKMAGNTLQSIAQQWAMSLQAAAAKLQPAGAVYHGMDEADVQRIIQSPFTMFGSDGLPCDPNPHPRLWGSFPRVLGHYARDKKLLPLAKAIHKMTALSSQEFSIPKRGLIQVGYFADLVLFDPATIKDTATFSQPQQLADGVLLVWVNGQLSYQHSQTTEYSALNVSSGVRQGQAIARAGRFLPNQSTTQLNNLLNKTGEL
ncbi:D-aminoacylase [Alteromonadaceae bacterium BrNp21-10]|nr:D-aminoacylase [Alteromonadaceae bacterium BrNp21-10]